MLFIAVLKMAIRAQKHVRVERFCARWAQIARLFSSTTMSVKIRKNQFLSEICTPGARGLGLQPPSLPGGRGPLLARGRVVGCTLWPVRSSKWPFGRQFTSSWRVFGRVELKSLGSFHRQPCPWKTENPFSSEICNPGPRGLGPQPPRPPGPGPGQMGGVPFRHQKISNRKQRSHFIKLPFGRCLVPACNDLGVVEKISDGTAETNTFWTQRAPQEWCNGAIERQFALKSRYFP